MAKTKLYLVVPCYNEEAVLRESVARLLGVLDRLPIDAGSRLLLVDDGSRDATWSIIAALSDENPRVEGVKLAHNAGHQNALWAGLMTARTRADAVVSIDADLQDDPEAIPAFLKAYEEGADIVYGVRASRRTDTRFKRGSAHLFYRFLQALGVELVFDHADYRLMSRRALDALSEYREVNLFLRGMAPMLGFRSAQVSYERHERFAGESKYPLKRMLALAMQGVLSLSDKPLQAVFWGGLTITGLAALGLLIALAAALAGAGVTGLAWILLTICLLGGLQIAAVGVVGLYVGKTHLESKHRPKYFIEQYKRRADQ